MHLLSDNQLVQLYVSGQETSFEILLKRHQKRVYSSIYLLVKDEELANDIFQDTFIKVIDNLRANKYSETGKFVLWVLQIARNLCMDHFRSTKKMRILHSTDERDVFAKIQLVDAPTESAIMQLQTNNQLKKMLDCLPEDQKEVVLMRLYGNLSFEEIATLTESNINTCLGRMRYALKNLRKHLQDHHIVL